jgi:MFS family permease
MAGMIYGFTGAGICFLINAASFFAVLLGLLAMRTRDFFPLERFERPAILRGTREGMAYVLKDRRMLVVLMLTFMLSTFAFNFNVTLPVLAYKTLGDASRPWVYGALSSLFGAGALLGALLAAHLGRASTKVMLLGAAVFTGAELGLAPVHTAWLAGVLLFVVGAGFTAWSANSNATMQLQAPDHLRGRIIGIYFYAFNGSASIAGFMVGWLCSFGGTELAFFVAGIVGLAATVWSGIRLGARPRRTIMALAGLAAHR